MDSTLKKKPKTMAEMLPGLGGLLSKNAIEEIALTAMKTSGPTMAHAQTCEKVLKPMTIAELSSGIKSLHRKSPKKTVQASASAKKKWNSSCKLENKTVSHIANGRMKHSSVRKVLDFQPPKPKVIKTFANPRITMKKAETLQLKKPEFKNTKSYIKAHNTVRISGICDIPETPVMTNSRVVLLKSRMTTFGNKENVPNRVIANKKLIATPKSILRKRMQGSKRPDTPNMSWKSSCDASFLQNEKNIEYIESKTKAMIEESVDIIAEVSPPISTPFADYRKVKEFFNNSSDVMENMFHENTIITFNKSDESFTKENSKLEESAIVSLCHMLNKASISHKDKNISKQLDDLLEFKKQAENNIKMIEKGISMFSNIKESELKSLQYINKLIQEKKAQQQSESTKEKTVIEDKEPPNLDKSKLNVDGIGEPSSVIKTGQKSSYKIPKRNNCMRKKLFHKSLPNMAGPVTPQKEIGEKALNIYLKMKEHNKYLSTPLLKQRATGVLDTPAATSHNLQNQLHKLYHES